MSKVVVDTSIIIDHLRERSDHFQQLQIQRAKGQINLFIPYVVIAELFAGQEAGRKGERRRIEAFLERFEFAELSLSSAKKAGEIIRKYPQIPGPIDAIIAAIAMDYEAQIATHNIKHFQQIRGLKLFDFSKKEITL